MLVMKFGGTSVGGPEQIRGVAAIVGGHRARRPVVVVSAITKVTDLLLGTARAAGAGDRETVRANLRRLNEVHQAAIDGAIEGPEARAEVTRQVAALLAQLRRACTGIVLLGELSARSLDAIASYGERCAALIVAGALRDAGPYNWWYRAAEAESELAAAGFEVQAIGFTPAATGGAMPATATEALSGRTDVTLYAACRAA